MNNPLHDRIVEAFAGMSGQLRAAARFALDRPHDVALLSMREIARLANVKPATMTRFAKYLGFDGYEAFREVYANAMRNGGLDFSRRAIDQVTNQELNGDQALAAQMAADLGIQMMQLADATTLTQLAEAVETLVNARHIYCLGMRSSFPVAWHFHYVLSLVQNNVRVLDGSGATGIDMLRHISTKDVLFVVSVAPYTRATVDIVEYATSQGFKIVAITDSPVAPIAESAFKLIRINTESRSFFHAIAPTFAAIEILAALITGRGGANTLAALKRTEDQLTAFGTHLNKMKREKP